MTFNDSLISLKNSVSILPIPISSDLLSKIISIHLNDDFKLNLY